MAACRSAFSARLWASIATIATAATIFWVFSVSIQTDDFAPSPASAPAARMLSGVPASGAEEAIERALRPKLLDDYVGQAKVREQLEIFIGAAKKRDEALDHVLLFGPPGLGKTTLSHIIAHELGVNLRQTSGPVL